MVNGNGQGLQLSGVNAATAAPVAIPKANQFPIVFPTTFPSELATLPQWTVSGSNATAIGTRLRVWAGADNNLYSTDLKVLAGASAPVTNQVSNLSMASTSVCAEPTVLSDYANPGNSALVFGAASFGCGAGPSDQFFIVPLSTGATASPLGPSLNEPVDVARDASGAIVQVLWIMHGVTPPTIGVSASLNTPPTSSLGQLAGTGLNQKNGGDFTSLAVVTQADGSHVWVYRDTSSIMAVNTNASAAPVVVFTKNDADVLSLPVLVDGTNVYLAWTDNQNQVMGTNPPQYTCQLIRIATAGTPSGVIALNETTLGSGGTTTGELPIGLSLVGVSGNDVVYFNNGITSGVGTVLLEAIPKTASGATGPTFAIDSETLPAQFNTATPPVTVANGVYYDVAAGSGNSTQVYFYNLPATSPSSGRVAVGGANGSVLLGGVLASPAPATQLASPVYASVLIAEPTANSGLSGATIIGFDGNGFNSAVLGTLPILTNDMYTGIALSEAPLQAGMPALVEVSGQQGSGNNHNATDLFVITPGTSGSLKQVTKNLQ